MSPRHWMYLLQLAIILEKHNAWKLSNYTSVTTDKWRVTWGYDQGPGSRRGHSLVLFNESAIILFGGRGDDEYRTHEPMSYDLAYSNGTWAFKSYHDKPLMQKSNSTNCQPTPSCFPLDNYDESNNSQYCFISWNEAVSDNMTLEQVKLKEQEYGFVRTTVFFNDVWMYNLHCSGEQDVVCTPKGWNILHPGSLNHCDKSSTICNAPGERWHHGAAMIDNRTMAIYGGFSPQCEDYCSDLWFFDLLEHQWFQYLFKDDQHKHPGKRWKFSMVSGRDASGGNIVLVFGGHRLWHGFSPDNAESNNWSNFDIIPKGGYLDDLWILQRNASNRSMNSGIWEKVTTADRCSAAGVDWISHNYDCLLPWPTARSNHAAVFDHERGGMWMYGGYTSYYPYPSTTSSGSGLGVKALLGYGVKPFSPSSFFLDDLWFYDTKKSIWLRIKMGSKKPHGRMDHVLAYSRHLLILHGGYADNFYYGDTWYFYIQNQTWQDKQEFVHADFPPECIDDLATIERDKSCVLLDFPTPLIRANDSAYPFQYQQILPFELQPGYTPKLDNLIYFGIVNNATSLVQDLKVKFLDNIVYDTHGRRVWIQSNIPDGTPIAPNAASGPRQYARQILHNFTSSITLNIWEWCISAVSEPTRDRPTDGLFGRSNVSIFIPQLRRLSPGWDGCRELHWLYPPSRSEHRGFFVPKYESLVIFGGLGYDMSNIKDAQPNHLSTEKTLKSKVLKDMWMLQLNVCMNNCSRQGTCLNGSCKCDVGFYGLDCSNITCPGSTCYYDEYHYQHCTHCCYDGYSHIMDGSDVYGSDARKVTCVPKALDSRGIFTGSSNGICDGFGSCQCAPPFVGDDCSILDCKHSCSFNGYCSLEFPVSRCICSIGYFGDYCQHKSCLNNCSYPNGKCDYNTGDCLCMPIISSYSGHQPGLQWQGEDCSYLPLWSAAPYSKYASWFVLTICIILISTIS